MAIEALERERKKDTEGERERESYIEREYIEREIVREKEKRCDELWTQLGSHCRMPWLIGGCFASQTCIVLANMQV